MNFDYVIVGAGSAGSVLANRLSASGRDSVLLLEAGPSDKRFYVRLPLGYGKVYYDKNVNWKYHTDPVPGLNHKVSYWPRGKVLGGSSSINAMVYVRGHPNDYQEWSEFATGWDWSSVEPVFRKMEDWVGGADEYRGEGGPLSINDISQDAHPLCQTYLDAAMQCQIPINADYNGASMDGAALYQITTRNGLRASSAVCYLHPAMHRHNLTVLTRAHVERVLFENNTATAVRFKRNGRVQTAHARKEIILCGGAINSPQLLQLSGIGPQALLEKHGVPLIHAASQVGRNLQDHLGADMVCRTNVDTLNQQLGPISGKIKVGLEFLLKRSGPLTLSLNQAGGFISMDKGSRLAQPSATAPSKAAARSNPAATPDLQLYFSPVSYTRAPVGTRPLINPDPFPGFLIGFNPCKPTSKGYLEIRSSNPSIAPKLVPNYLDTQHDQDLMLGGMKLMRQLTAAPALAAVIEEELMPGGEKVSDEQLMEFIRDNAWTVFHQCGTCRMGDDPQASVVDARLKVHGVNGLRVADASVFPTIPTGNTNAPAIMVGERASELILQESTA